MLSAPILAPSLSEAERRRSRTDRAWGCHAAPVLKTGWATGPMPLPGQRRPGRCLELAVAGFDQTEGRIHEQARRREAEQPASVRLVRELLQGAVEADRLSRVVLEGRLDHEGADQAEDHGP